MMTFESEHPKLISSDWHHAPPHRFIPGLSYIVTAATLYRQHFFRTDESLRFLERSLLDVLAAANWTMHAWSVFSNHYHFIAHDLGLTTSLKDMISELHSRTAIELNQLHKTAGRQVWYQYWDRRLTFESSYWARLNYVNNNPVKHGLVGLASNYPYCSARHFETQCSAQFLRRLSTYGYERVKEYDEFQPVWEGSEESDR